MLNNFLEEKWKADGCQISEPYDDVAEDMERQKEAVLALERTLDGILQKPGKTALSKAYKMKTFDCKDCINSRKGNVFHENAKCKHCVVDSRNMNERPTGYQTQNGRRKT